MENKYFNKMDFLFKLESMEIFTQVLDDTLDNLYDLDHGLTNNEINAYSMTTLKNDLKELILKTNLNMSEVTSLLTGKYVDNDKVNIFVSLLEDKKTRLLYLAIIHYYCTFGETLDTFDWKLKLVCGTSDLKTLFYPYLQLALNTVNVNHKLNKRIYEVNKDTLLRLIGCLEELIDDNTNN